MLALCRYIDLEVRSEVADFDDTEVIFFDHATVPECHRW